MPSIGEALAATIVQAALSETEADGSLAAFPNFFFPVTADSLASDRRSAAFDFMHRINMIPHRPPVFAMSADFVWAAYARILAERRLAPPLPNTVGDGPRFVHAVAQMGDGELTTTDNAYWVTTVLPADLSAPGAWTPYALGGTTIAALAAAIPVREQEWFARFNTLTELGRGLIEEISFERATLVVLRPWYDPSLFELHGWTLDGEPVSDGGDPAAGRLPATIGKLVLLRNLRLKLASTRLPDIGPTLVYRRVPDVAAAPDLSPVNMLRMLSATGLAPMLLREPLSAEGGPIGQQVDAIADLSSLETEGGDAGPAHIPGAQKFHVPFALDGAAARAVAAAELAAADAAVAALDAVIAPLQAEHDELRTEVERLKSVAHDRGGLFRLRYPLLIRGKVARLAIVDASLQTQTAARDGAHGEQARCQRAVQLLDQIDAITGDPSGAYVLSVLCDRVAKSPIPDPMLFEGSVPG